MVPLLTVSGQTNLYESGKRAFDSGDYAAAAGHFGADIRNVKLTGDTISIAFADELNLMASALYRQGKADEAVGYGLRALHLYEALFGQASEDYAMQCVNLATYYYDMGEYGESISYENFAIRSYDRQGVNYFAEKGQERLTVMYEEAAAAGIDVRMGFNPQIQMSEVFDTDIQRQWSSGTDLSYVRQCRARVDRLYDSGDSTSLNYFHAVDSLAMAYIAVREAPRAASWVEYWGARKNELCGDRSVESMRTYYIYALAAFHSNDIPEAEDRASTVINVLDGLTERDDDTYLNALMLRCSCYLHMGILGSVRKEMPRLLSFAESAFGRDSGKGGTIYGGLFYDASLDDTAAAAAQQASTVRGAGGGLPYLEGTEMEADQLYNMMRANMQSGASVSLLKGAEGTETSFKALAGRGNRILHIGTHGFYSPAQQQAAEDRDLSMIRSGLYMAGADYGMQADDAAAAGADDGVLTAEEIAAVDLRGLDMVSLSACETALGDISGEGVFGLQRGFKKAGAGSILMSLWKVDDEATCLLMTEFYKHWLSEGCTKYAALELAKRAVRSHTDRGWDNPRYWAAFILLDGID